MNEKLNNALMQSLGVAQEMLEMLIGKTHLPLVTDSHGIEFPPYMATCGGCSGSCEGDCDGSCMGDCNGTCLGCDGSCDGFNR